MKRLVLGQNLFKMDENVRVFILESDEGNIEFSPLNPALGICSFEVGG